MYSAFHTVSTTRRAYSRVAYKTPFYVWLLSYSFINKMSNKLSPTNMYQFELDSIITYRENASLMETYSSDNNEM